MARNLYDVVGTQPDATNQQIHRAWRHQAARLHPDTVIAAGGSDQQLGDAEAKIRELNQAYEVLNDPIRRRAYDATLPLATGSTASSAPKIVTTTQVKAPDTAANKKTAWAIPLVLATVVLLFLIVINAANRRTNSSTDTVPKLAGTTTIATISLGDSDTASAIGKCLFRSSDGDDALGTCDQPSNGLVVAVASQPSECPSTTTAHRLVGASNVLCLVDGLRLNNGVPGL
jgi:hypothetical protein